jgi:hypothetical protein
LPDNKERKTWDKLKGKIDRENDEGSRLRKVHYKNGGEMTKKLRLAYDGRERRDSSI